MNRWWTKRRRRIIYAAEAEQLGRGGKTRISALTGMSRSANKERRREVGGGRKKITESEPSLLSALESLLEPVTRGDPESPLRWTVKSTRILSKELENKGFTVGKSRVATLLDEMGYSLGKKILLKLIDTDAKQVDIYEWCRKAVSSFKLFHILPYSLFIISLQKASN